MFTRNSGTKILVLMAFYFRHCFRAFCMGYVQTQRRRGAEDAEGIGFREGFGNRAAMVATLRNPRRLADLAPLDFGNHSDGFW